MNFLKIAAFVLLVALSGGVVVGGLGAALGALAFRSKRAAKIGGIIGGVLGALLVILFVF